MVRKAEQPKEYFATIRMPYPLWEQLQALAERNERTTAGEIRLALYRHLEAEHARRVAETKQ